MTTLANKIDFAVILRTTKANPNGDPLNGNRPRIDYDGYGEISDVCIKRKIRDRLMEAKDESGDYLFSIFVQSDERKVDDAKSLKDRADRAFKDNLTVENACKKWFDVRAFGQVFAFKSANSKKKKGEDKEEGGDTGVSIPIRGPVSIHSAFSVDPIRQESIQITKSVNSETTEDGKKSSDTMGMKHRVDDAVYVFFGSMNPQLAEKTGFSNDDALTIKEILPRIFENDESSARPAGSMRVLKVFWWDHGCKAGKHSSAKVHGSLKVKSDGSYYLDNIEGLEPEIIDGF
ncbi:MAG: type I-C CRISPR-associated protein Cas7/Csd2 [Acinetobacter sp.]|uniref:type I-C CRISPR-associated protein Cas7/Csd2 n=1 Tax=Acinetobacter sp. TaxID=472 RepID=UPI002586D27F|nr:type I-C CRISPR-associated protein Cas7/Csd2 [Acinetobacter sp.]MCE1271874.1 type I-C CRISPR-associated protein Cas7/Csd2 [Acinetobacter sp.]